MATNLFSSSRFSGQLDIILLAHTLGTCDFFLPRVLPYRARSSSSPTTHPPWDRPKRSRGRDKSFSLFPFPLTRSGSAGERNNCTWYSVISDSKDRRLWRVRKLWARLKRHAAYILSPLEVVGFHQKPPWPAARRLAEKSKFYVSPSISPVTFTREKKRRRMDSPIRLIQKHEARSGKRPLRPRVRHPVAFFFVNHRRARVVTRPRVNHELGAPVPTHSISVASARQRKSNAGRMPAKVLGCPRSGPRQRPQERRAFVGLYLHFSEIIVILIETAMRADFTVSISCLPRENRNGQLSKLRLLLIRSFSNTFILTMRYWINLYVEKLVETDEESFVYPHSKTSIDDPRFNILSPLTNPYYFTSIAVEMKSRLRYLKEVQRIPLSPSWSNYEI